jgi:tetratricopeptide (TPR) repeat protein
MIRFTDIFLLINDVLSERCMKRYIICIFICFLTGCSWMPFVHETDNTQKEQHTVRVAVARVALPSYSGVSPEARTQVEAARACWTESGECVSPEKAASLLDKAIAADPLDATPYLLRSLALSELGYMTEAFDDATRAVRIAPTAESYAVRGLVCLKQNQMEGAHRDFAYAEKLNDAEPLLYVYRAAGAFLENKTRAACIDLEHACTLGLCAPWESAKTDKVCR